MTVLDGQCGGDVLLPNSKRIGEVTFDLEDKLAVGVDEELGLDGGLKTNCTTELEVAEASLEAVKLVLESGEIENLVRVSILGGKKVVATGAKVKGKLLVMFGELGIDIFLQMINIDKQGEALTLELFLDMLEVVEGVSEASLERGEPTGGTEEAAEPAASSGVVESLDGALHLVEEVADFRKTTLSKREGALNGRLELILELVAIADDGRAVVEVDLGSEFRELLALFGGEFEVRI